jgi:hypothetical protein
MGNARTQRISGSHLLRLGGRHPTSAGSSPRTKRYTAKHRALHTLISTKRKRFR